MRTESGVAPVDRQRVDSETQTSSMQIGERRIRAEGGRAGETRDVMHAPARWDLGDERRRIRRRRMVERRVQIASGADDHQLRLWGRRGGHGAASRNSRVRAVARLAALARRRRSLRATVHIVCHDDTGERRRSDCKAEPRNQQSRKPVEHE